MNFKEQVTDLSFEIPVVVDFWAPWCGPCQYLGPLLDELSEEAKGAWKLVKVNVDENPEVSEKYKIRGIPDVRLFAKGQSVAGFTGAMPKPQILKWLQEHLPDERKDVLEAIRNELKENKEVALKRLEAFVASNPDLAESSFLLAEYIVFKDHEKALKLIEPFGGQVEFLDRMENIKALARLMDYDGNGNSAVHEKLEVVKRSIEKDDFDNAINALIEAVMIDKTYAEELPRQATVAVFKLLGEDHDLTRKYRRRFDMALY